MYIHTSDNSMCTTTMIVENSSISRYKNGGVIFKLCEIFQFCYLIRFLRIQITHCSNFQLNYPLIRLKMITKCHHVPIIPILHHRNEKWHMVSFNDNFHTNQIIIELKASTMGNLDA